VPRYERADRHPRRLDGGEHGLGVGTKGAARLGRHEPAADALEELDAELGLEPADLLGERRLGEVQRLGGGAERALLEGCYHVLQLLKIHRLCLEFMKTIKATAGAHKGPSCRS
jgi:hypothetical protein